MVNMLKLYLLFNLVHMILPITDTTANHPKYGKHYDAETHSAKTAMKHEKAAHVCKNELCMFNVTGQTTLLTESKEIPSQKHLLELEDF